MKSALLILALFCLLAPPSFAEMKYYPDPVYQKLGDDDSSPMDEMFNLAQQGDVRAQFIMGDLYSKGKGGVAKDIKEARRWFEESAVYGYAHSFIRLAALARRENRPVEAWQWYTLAIDAFDYGDGQKYAITARRDLAESARLTPEEMARARKAVRAWKEARDDRLRQEQAEQREKEKREKEEMEKWQAAVSVQEEKTNEQN
jgi:TPR repeat protein